jgi:hypothetical protein
VTEDTFVTLIDGSLAMRIPDMRATPPDEYAPLRRRDRRVVRLEEFTDAEMALIATTEVLADDAHLDDELKDWKP